MNWWRRSETCRAPLSSRMSGPRDPDETHTWLGVQASADDDVHWRKRNGDIQHLVGQLPVGGAR